MAKIFIDPGHGGHDNGATAYGLFEKNLTLTIALKIRDYLNKHYTGHTIKMSRTTDKYLTLTQRTNMANAWGADYFISVHINAGGGIGYEDFIYNGNVSNATRSYQTVMHNEIVKATKWTTRGKKRANFAVIRQTNMPAILTENGFIDNKSDADKLKSNAFLNKIAEGHAKGIAAIFKLNKKSNAGRATKPSSPKKDKEIEQLQKDLKALGYDPGKVDGLDGPDTQNAVKAFQKAEGLTVDGIAGKITKAEIKRIKNGGLTMSEAKTINTRLDKIEKELAKKEDKRTNVDQPSDWAKGDWEEATKKGYFDGSKPKANITREQTAIVINRLRNRIKAGEEKFKK